MPNNDDLFAGLEVNGKLVSGGQPTVSLSPTLEPVDNSDLFEGLEIGGDVVGQITPETGKRGFTDIFTGSERIAARPELGTLPEFGTTQEGDTPTIALGFLSTFDPQAQMDIIKETIPESSFETFDDGTTVIEVPTADGGVRRSVLNRPGFSPQDLTTSVAQALSFVPAARLAGLGKTLMAKIGIGGAAAGATEQALQETGIALGREERDPLATGLAVGLGGVAEAVVPVIQGLRTARQAKQFGAAVDELDQLKPTVETAQAATEATNIPLFQAQQTLVPTQLEKQAFVTQLPAGTQAAVKGLKAQNQAAGDAVETFINNIAPPEAVITGAEKVRTAAQNAVAKIKDIRKEKASPLFQQAFKEGADVDLKPVNDLITEELAELPATGEIAKSLNKIQSLIKGKAATPVAPLTIKSEASPFASPSFKSAERLSTKGGSIDIVESEFAPAKNSIVEFFVDEGSRGQGIGGQLLDEAIKKYGGDLSGAFSSKESLQAAYNRGFRGLGGNKGKTLAKLEAERAANSSVTLSHTAGTAKPAAAASPDLGLKSVPLRNGNEVGTGKPFKGFFVKNTENVKAQGQAAGIDFGQNLEPKGDFINVSQSDIIAKSPPPGFVGGEVSFNNPLVLEFKSTNSQGWKKDLSDLYGGKTGKALTTAIEKDGFDGILTVDGGQLDEAVRLSAVSGKTAKPAAVDPVQATAQAVKKPSLRLLHNAKLEIDQMLNKVGESSLGNTTKTKLTAVKAALLQQIDDASPAYSQARKTFAAESPAVTKIQESIIGKIADLDDTQLKQVASKIFDPQQTNPQVMLKAKKSIQDVDPDAWNEIVRVEIERRLGGVRATAESGTIENIPGQLFKALFPNDKSTRVLMNALDANGKANLKFLQTSLGRARLGRAGGSQTAAREEIKKELRGGFTEGIRGFLGRPIHQTGQAAVTAVSGSTAESAFNKRVATLSKALFDPTWKAEMKKIRALNPNSPASARAMTQLLNDVEQVDSRSNTE
tara:strand:+ start:30752 stop:33736 length:2985 start_codon:yes stop_codon:yes gene_type:complete